MGTRLVLSELSNYNTRQLSMKQNQFEIGGGEITVIS